jgi:hypothetical protein
VVCTNSHQCNITIKMTHLKDRFPWIFTEYTDTFHRTAKSWNKYIILINYIINASINSLALIAPFNRDEAVGLQRNAATMPTLLHRFIIEFS